MPLLSPALHGHHLKLEGTKLHSVLQSTSIAFGDTFSTDFSPPAAYCRKWSLAVHLESPAALCVPAPSTRASVHRSNACAFLTERMNELRLHEDQGGLVGIAASRRQAWGSCSSQKRSVAWLMLKRRTRQGGQAADLSAKHRCGQGCNHQGQQAVRCRRLLDGSSCKLDAQPEAAGAVARRVVMTFCLQGTLPEIRKVVATMVCRLRRRRRLSWRLVNPPQSNLTSVFSEAGC